jgi:spermidine/putrescine transport system ATP-binding protein
MQAVTLDHVHKRFGELVAVDSLDLEIGQAEFFSIIGPSGCGKTTTLRMIAGFEEPTSGTIHVAGRDVTHVRPYRRPVNTVFQSYALFPHLDVYENVAFGLREARRPRDEIRQRVGEAIALVQLEGRERSRPQQLSGGQQQRVALARALVNRPEVLLLDEPLGALDLKLRAEMQTQLKDLQRAVGITFCYVTHDQGEAFSMSDRVAVMNSGVLEQVGPPEDVYRRPGSLFVADFVGSANRLHGEVTSPEGHDGYGVRLDGLGERRVPGPAGIATGSRVVMLVRPEDIDIVPADAAGSTGIGATVIDTAFLGAQRTFRLDTGAGRQFTATTRAGGTPFASGANVQLRWQDGDAWVLPVTTTT